MNPASFSDLERTLADQGPTAAFARLADGLREGKDFDGLFYARLAARRHELGASPIPTGPVSDIPADKQGAFGTPSARPAARWAGSTWPRARSPRPGPTSR
jgi:hypothetical protein